MFIHGGLLHIGGNMLFLWVFGDNVEDALGKIRYFLFYLLCGLAGGLLHILIGINSKIPAVGASGAISGILGGYVILFPRARILALVPLFYFIRIMYLPAFAFIGIWFFYQLLYAASSHGGGVAWFAHIGGFLAGVFLVLIFRKGRRRSWDWF
jgi:membrane associated rhomboid family serine protease